MEKNLKYCEGWKSSEMTGILYLKVGVPHVGCVEQSVASLSLSRSGLWLCPFSSSPSVRANREAVVRCSVHVSMQECRAALAPTVGTSHFES